MIERVINHHKSFIVKHFKERVDPDFRCEVRRSLRMLREIRDNGNTIQVFGSAMR